MRASRSAAVAGLLYLGTVLALALGSPETAAAASGYWTITDLGALPGGATSNAMAINGMTQVVGEADVNAKTSHAYRWQNGVMTDLNMNGQFPTWSNTTGTHAKAINSAGDVAGFSNGSPSAPADSLKSWLWSAGTVMILGTMNDATGVNVHRQVVGYAGVNGFAHATLWQNGTQTDLGTLGGRLSFATGINDAAQVVGQSEGANETGGYAFVWQNGTMTSLGTLGGCSSTAFAINAAADIAGIADTKGNCGALSHAFLRKGGVMRDLGTLPGDTFSKALAINDRDQVVGISIQPWTNYQRPFLWSNGVMTDLTTVIDPGQHWVLGDAVGINNRGQIVGTGTHFGT
ncbi:MAG: HAF repeat-containing protein, partial [Candidatus Dormibacteraeota bacterium]|nr:HAF repeat-containing protein [Candidatus Dormibacteraeota bacterium]